MSESLNDRPQGCCSHLKVKWQTAEHAKGGTIGWWACKTCGQNFMPVPPASSATIDEYMKGFNKCLSAMTRAISEIAEKNS